MGKKQSIETQYLCPTCHCSNQITITKEKKKDFDDNTILVILAKCPICGMDEGTEIILEQVDHGG